MEPSFRAKLVERRTYSRPKGDGTFETWDEIIDRVIGHQKWLWSNAQGGDLNQAQKKELGDLKTLLLNRQVMLAGRTLWLGGTDVAKRRQATNFNCSFLRVKTIHDVVDAYWLLMQGCGVGFEPITGVLSGFNRPCNDVEIIRSRGSVSKGREHNIETYVDGLWTISVGDSAEAWVKAVGKLFAEKRPITKLILDFSEIRVAGTRLSQYGWISSGDSTIAIALPKIITLLNGASGRLLTKIEILDVMNWLGTTLSSRRSAEIALLPYHDPEADAFIDAKSGAFYNDNPQRTQSNNSVVFWTKPPKRELKGMFQTLVDNGGAEPGFINGSASYERAKYFAGVNPSLRGGTLVYTTEGFFPIKQLENKTFNVLTANKTLAEARCWLSDPCATLWKLELDNGAVHYATAQHEWPLIDGSKARTDKLISGNRIKFGGVDNLLYGSYGSNEEGFLAGYTFGNGWVGKDYFGLSVREDRLTKLEPILKSSMLNLGINPNFTNKKGNSIEFTTRGTSIVNWFNSIGWNGKDSLPNNLFNKASEQFRKGFIRGWYEADGSSSEGRIGISNKSKKPLEELQILLGAYGIKSYLGSRIHKEIIINGHTYTNYTIYMLRVNDNKSAARMVELFNLPYNIPIKTKYLKNNTDYVTVVACEKTNLKEPVWDISVLDTTHTFQLGNCFTGNCAEILLGDKSFCNLVEVNLPSFNGNWVALHDAVRLVSRANYRQTCVDLRDGILQASWHELNDFLRLTGVSLTGIMEWEHRDNPRALEQLREIAKGSVAVMAHELDLPPSQNTTTVKPSGTLSKLMDTTEGIHKPLGKYIFNNINFSKDDPLIELCRRAGYKVFENPLSTDGMLVTVPVKYKDCGFTDVNGTLVNNDSAIDQLERYKRMMLHYVDHNCSNTISYSPDEVPAIVDWLDKNWDTYVGVSWLFRNDPTKRAVDLGFAYLPQEVVTKEEYESYKSTLKEVNFNNQLGSEDLSMVDDGCASGQCPIR